MECARQLKEMPRIRSPSTTELIGTAEILGNYDKNEAGVTSNKTYKVGSAFTHRGQNRRALMSACSLYNFTMLLPLL